MQILLNDIGKKFGKEWIFRGITYDVKENTTIALIGPNGSGKSTLLKIISTISEPTKGSAEYLLDGEKADLEKAPLNMSFAAPYLNLIEELTLREHLDFHFNFKNYIGDINDNVRRAGLSKALNKRISEFSSGMKQRLRLLLALYTDSRLLLLDEPTSNMDEDGIEWYLNEMNKFSGSRTIIIASNQRYEYDFTSEIIDLANFKS